MGTIKFSTVDRILPWIEFTALKTILRNFKNLYILHRIRDCLKRGLLYGIISAITEQNIWKNVKLNYQLN